MLDGTGQLERFDVISESSKVASCQAFYLSLLWPEL